MTADGFEKHFGIQSMLKVHWSILQWLQIDYREKADIKKKNNLQSQNFVCVLFSPA